MNLSLVDYINGISSLIYVAVTILVGLIILFKYFKVGNRAFLLVGLTWMGMSQPWLPSGVSFLWNLIFKVGLPFEAYVLIGNLLTPVPLICWMTAFTDLLYKEYQKFIVLLYVIVCILFEIVFFTLLTTDQSGIGIWGEGSEIVHIDIEYKGFILGYDVFIVLTMLITGIIFARNSLQSKVPEINLKGKFLLIAFLAWSIGGLLDSAIPLNPFTLPITRVLLVSSALLFYIGYVLPPGIKDIVLKE